MRVPPHPDRRPTLAVTLGDPRGIGPEVVRRAAEEFLRGGPSVDLILLGPDGMDPGLSAYDSVGPWDGTQDGAGRVSVAAIESAVTMAQSGRASGILTGPVHKPALHAAGSRHPGQTEMLQALTGVNPVGMLMCAERTQLGPPLRVLLATTHLPLIDVGRRLTSEVLVEQTGLLSEALRVDWGMAEPRIALCAFNPHASDDGLFGDEEVRIYGPALDELHSAGTMVVGPIPADTVFVRAVHGEFDAVVAPYHDVAMAAFKTVSFGTGVNVTLGLPFVRTSPDHGTAFDIAGRGVADSSSTLEALKLAAQILSNRSAAGPRTPAPIRGPDSPDASRRIGARTP